MSDKAILQALFNQQRLQILELGTVHNKFSDDYLFAWESGVYPLFSDTDGSVPQRPHEVYKDNFVVSPEQVKNIFDFLCTRSREKQPPTFYELEDHFGGKFDGSYGRGTLIDCCRYFFLHRCFDKTFWPILLTPMQHPSEATYLDEPLDRDDIFFN
ncbi:hypothetical protein EKN56_06420 [Limnobaculum zhutongyuii]|uniref:Uncharacterized protein n=1 Tax=Limnobaculum zhutongyuii TaxID=2498113 RepID=A0A411WIN8_9GAMM|nr:hypothetical protein [Limnobaculum zhutongyuii]QBH96064.1 hypothetical protein EKN56_06420 [Limnobaculum zhutongyuii]TQS86153.1 hypothetical protein ELQ32_20275 [Limnobaculum zhutongyuii]